MSITPEKKPSASMMIASSILRENPEIADNTKLLQAILEGLKKAILDERKACQEEADKHFDHQGSNRPEYDNIQSAVIFTKNAISANISKDIEDREKP
jgi:hypothetical protein